MSLMSKKVILTKAVALLSVIGVSCLLVVLVSALGPSAREKSKIVSINLSGIAPGQVKMVKASLPLYIVSPTDEMLGDLDILSDHVWDRKISTEYTMSNGTRYFIFYGVQKVVPSCLPKLYKKDEPNSYRADSAMWLGGFWDLCRDVSYDYAGRTIRDIQYAYINFSRKLPNLPPVIGIRDDGEKLSLYDGEREN